MGVAAEIGAKLIVSHSFVLGTAAGLARSLYVGSSAILPPRSTGKVGPFLTLIETGGTGSARTQNNTATERPTVQLAARGETVTAAKSLLQDAYEALGGPNGLYNLTLMWTIEEGAVVATSVFYLGIVARQVPTDTGQDGAGRAMVVFNIDAEKQPS